MPPRRRRSPITQRKSHTRLTTHILAAPQPSELPRLASAPHSGPPLPLLRAETSSEAARSAAPLRHLQAVSLGPLRRPRLARRLQRPPSAVRNDEAREYCRGILHVQCIAWIL